MPAQPRRPSPSRSPRAAASLLALLIAATGLAGCGGPAPTTAGAAVPSTEPGLKVYRHSLDEAPASLDPVQASTIYSNHVIVNAYDTLFSYKYLARPYLLKPNLADGWPEISPDLLTYRIKLKRGVFYQNDPCFPDGKGREVVAEDVVYSLKREFDPAARPQGAWFWQGRIVGIDDWKEAGSDYSKEIPGLRALDSHTLQIVLTRPYPQLLDTFAQGYAAVVPHEAVEYYGRELGTHPVGSGPFQLVAFDTARVVMDRNPSFRQEPVDLEDEGYDPATQRFSGVERIQGRSPPFIDRLIIDFAKDETSRWNSLTKGDEIQLALVPEEKVAEIVDSKRPVRLKKEFAENYQVATGIEAGLVFDAFNMNFPDFGYSSDPERERRNKALRCAITKANDREAFNESWYSGLGVIFPGIIPPAVPEYDPDFPPESVQPDVEGARKLLRDNGWTPDNLPVLVYGQAAGVKQRMWYEQFRAWMMDIGWPPEKIQYKAYATFGDISRAWKESKLPMVFKGWGLDYPDAENTLQLFYGPNGSPGSNDSNYKNPEYDRLYKQSSVMLPSPERTAMYRRMNQMLVDDCVTMPGIARNRIYLWHKNVVTFPDREIVSGFSLKYVDVLPEGESARPPDLEPAG